MLYKILTLTPLADYQIRLVYADGFETIVDFKSTIAQGGVFSTLADPQVFSQAKLGEDGRYITWGDVDFCADGLRLEDSKPKLESVQMPAKS